MSREICGLVLELVLRSTYQPDVAFLRAHLNDSEVDGYVPLTRLTIRCIRINQRCRGAHRPPCDLRPIYRWLEYGYGGWQHQRNRCRAESKIACSSLLGCPRQARGCTVAGRQIRVAVMLVPDCEISLQSRESFPMLRRSSSTVNATSSLRGRRRPAVPMAGHDSWSRISYIEALLVVQGWCVRYSWPATRWTEGRSRTRNRKCQKQRAGHVCCVRAKRNCALARAQATQTMARQELQ